MADERLFFVPEGLPEELKGAEAGFSDVLSVAVGGLPDCFDDGLLFLEDFERRFYGGRPEVCGADRRLRFFPEDVEVSATA